MNTKAMQPDVKKEFKKIIGLEHIVNQASGSDLYYNYQDKLKAALVIFLRYDFSVLNTKQLLKLTSLVSTHRPIAPHSFLIICSNLIND